MQVFFATFSGFFGLYFWRGLGRCPYHSWAGAQQSDGQSLAAYCLSRLAHHDHCRECLRNSERSTLLMHGKRAFPSTNVKGSRYVAKIILPSSLQSSLPLPEMTLTKPNGPST